MKLSHLRRLPRPPARSEPFTALVELTRQATAKRGMDAKLRRHLDETVFDLFGVAPGDRTQIRGLLAERAARFGYA